MTIIDKRVKKSHTLAAIKTVKIEEVLTMHQYTHAWLAFMAIKRLEKVALGKNEPDNKYASGLIDWFKNNRDCVVQGAWYPDKVIKDNSSSHILKILPYDQGNKEYIDEKVKKNQVKLVPPEGFKILPPEYLCYKNWGEKSALREKSFAVDLKTNLPDRCESFTETVIDHIKMQTLENRGSPVSPTSNQVAFLLFMQSHYIADAHVPLHCDGRSFNEENKFHSDLEEVWEKDIKDICERDLTNKKSPRFVYDKSGYPAVIEKKFNGSYLEDVWKDMGTRDLGKMDSYFLSSNNNVWDFMSAICQNSYLVSYHFFAPEKLDDPKNPDFNKWVANNNHSLDELSYAVLADAADSIARIWLRCWRRVEVWKSGKQATQQNIQKNVKINQP
jgi:hypothetical protein